MKKRLRGFPAGNSSTMVQIKYLMLTGILFTCIPPAPALEPGFVSGDVVSFSHVPNQYWSLENGYGLLPYLCEYGPLKIENDRLAPHHSENIRRIDIAARWSTAFMFYARRKSWNAEIIDLMLRAYQHRQLFVIRCYARPDDADPFGNMVDLLDRLWQNRDTVLENPEGDRATGRRLINNILAVKMGDERLKELGTAGLESLYRIFKMRICDAEKDDEYPFRHIKPWYNLLGYFAKVYAANEADIAGGHIPLPQNTEFIGVDTYHYWYENAGDPLLYDADHLVEMAQDWQDVQTRSYPEGLDFIGGCDDWRPECRNDTHALRSAIDLAGAQKAMMFFIGVTGRLTPHCYPTPAEVYESYYHNLKNGPWVGLSWWLFGDYKNMSGGLHFIDRTVVDLYQRPYPHWVQDFFHHRYLDAKINMFRDVVYNQFRDLNYDPHGPGQWQDPVVHFSGTRTDSIVIRVKDKGANASGINYFSPRVRIQQHGIEEWMTVYPLSAHFDGTYASLRRSGDWRRVLNTAAAAAENFTGNMLTIKSQSGSRVWYENRWGTHTGGTLVAKIKLNEQTANPHAENLKMGNQKVRITLNITPNTVELGDGENSVFYTLDTREWHIYRITLKERRAALYIDEDPVPVIQIDAGVKPGGGYMSFGSASAENGRQDISFDWVKCCAGAAPAPRQGLLMPLEARLLNTRQSASLSFVPDPSITPIERIQFSIKDLYGNTGKSPVYTLYVVPVELSGFRASVENMSVDLTWQTESETENLAFILYRRFRNAPWVKISEIRPENSHSTVRQRYRYTDFPQAAGVYRYRLSQLDLDGSETHLSVIHVEIPEPNGFQVAASWPNPFSSVTPAHIRFSLPAAGFCRVNVYNTLGQHVCCLLSAQLGKGIHQLSWRGEDGNGYPVAPGIYFYSVAYKEKVYTGTLFKDGTRP